MKQKSAPPQLLPSPPESFFVFVVGHCEEWPEGRDEQGDTAIYKEYRNVGVPADQCIYIKDRDCTRENCQETLETFLRRETTSSSPQQQSSSRESAVSRQEEKGGPKTLIFYYGGHGSANGFATIGGTWTYRQVAQTIEELFHGERVLFLLDCCAAGNLWQKFPSSSSSASNATAKKQYVLLATSQPYIETSADGDEWIISNTWIQLMRHSRSSDEDYDDYYLKLENMISLLADRHVFELGDMFFAYVTPTTLSRNSRREIDNSWSWMPIWCRRQQQISEELCSSLPSLQALLQTSESESLSENLNRMPEKAKISSIHDCRVGDAIAYKHPGGCPLTLVASAPFSSSSVELDEEPLPFYVPPVWLNGTIISIFEDDRDRKEAQPKNSDLDYSNILLRIRVWYPSQIEPWEVEISHHSPSLINHFFVAQSWMLPKSFLETQVVLAKKYQQYLDCSVATNTPVRVALGQAAADGIDDAVEGTILDWKDFRWKRLLNSCTGENPGTTGYDEYYWNELPVPIKTAATALGYTKSSWDNDTGIPAEKMSWDVLSAVQKDAAAVLKYVPPKSSVSSLGESNGIDVLDLNNRKASFWESVSEISTCFGPHVPVEWNNNSQHSFVPLNQIFLPNTRINNVAVNETKNTMTRPRPSITKEKLPDDNLVEPLQRGSLIRGLKSSGRSIRNAESIFGTKKLSAFWVDEEIWYDAAPICNNEISLDLLATHFDYTLPGVYCPVEYEDGERYLIPLNYIFRRGCHPRQEEEGDGESDNESDSVNDNDSKTKESTSTTPISTEAIDEITKSLLDISMKISSFGKKFSGAVSKLEEASSSMRTSFNMSESDRCKEQHGGNVDKLSSNTATSRAITETLPVTTTKSYLDDDWSDLPRQIKTVAKRIGYNKKLWDSDLCIPLELKEWKDLNSNEMEDLQIIGYNESIWRKQDNSDDSDSSDDDY